MLKFIELYTKKKSILLHDHVKNKTLKRLSDMSDTSSLFHFESFRIEELRVQLVCVDKAYSTIVVITRTDTVANSRLTNIR